MQLLHCELELHENLFFATREMGRLYECEAYLHNYALSYALGLVAAPYFQATQIPSYADELTELNEREIYVTPARPIAVTHELTTFKYANNGYHVEMLPARSNVPSFGRAKELAVGSRLAFAIVCRSEPPPLPRWIRLGLWRSKARVTYTPYDLEESRTTESGILLSYPINPLDLADLSRLPVYDLISMRPTSLLDNVRYHGLVWQSQGEGSKIVIPVDLAYRFPT